MIWNVATSIWVYFHDFLPELQIRIMSIGVKGMSFQLLLCRISRKECFGVFFILLSILLIFFLFILQNQGMTEERPSPVSEFPFIFNLSTVLDDNYVQFQQFGVFFKSVSFSSRTWMKKWIIYHRMFVKVIKCVLCVLLLDRMGGAVDNWIDFLSHCRDVDDSRESETCYCPGFSLPSHAYVPFPAAPFSSGRHIII